MTHRIQVAHQLAAGAATVPSLHASLGGTLSGIRSAIKRMARSGHVRQAGYGAALPHCRPPARWRLTSSGREYALRTLGFDMPVMAACKNKPKAEPFSRMRVPGRAVNSVFAWGEA